MRTHAGRAVAGLLLGLLLTTGCGGEDDVNGDEATAALEQQRTDVREAARSLLRAAGEQLSGRVSNDVGGWRGCDSAFPEEFRNFRYLAQARVDLPTDAADPLEALRTVLEEGGFTVKASEGPGPRRTLHGVRDSLRATFADTGAGRFVLATFSGTCVDVPEEDRAMWQRKDEPTPGLI